MILTMPPNQCDFVDPDGDIWFFFLDHGLWEPDDQIERRSPGPAADLAGVMFAASLRHRVTAA